VLIVDNFSRLHDSPPPGVIIHSGGVATGCTGVVDIFTPLLLAVVPEIDANPASFCVEWGMEESGRLLSKLDSPVCKNTENEANLPLSAQRSPFPPHIF